MEVGNSSQKSNIFRYNRKVLTIIDGDKHYEIFLVVRLADKFAL